MVNARGQNGLQFMIQYFNATDAHFRLQAPINKQSYLSIAKLLLDSGLDPNVPDLLTGETIVYDAIRLNDRDMVNLLLNYIDFTYRNKNGETMLMCAARFGSKQTMRLILEHLRSLEMDGYFLRQRNRFGLTALELARAENLDSAKVLTKHLITYGQHTGAILSRSTSHHHLRALAPYHPLRAAAPVINASRASAAACLLDDSASDYSDCDLLPASAATGRMPRGSVTRAMLTGYKTGAGLYDPKAAEFNQYLLEQQELSPSSAAAVAAGTLGMSEQQQSFNGLSDDDDYFGIGQSSSGLTRSRSCMLGPSGNQQGMKQAAKFGAPSSRNKNTSNEMQASSSTAMNKHNPNWEMDGGGAGQRGTIS